MSAPYFRILFALPRLSASRCFDSFHFLARASASLLGSGPAESKRPSTPVFAVAGALVVFPCFVRIIEEMNVCDILSPTHYQSPDGLRALERN